MTYRSPHFRSAHLRRTKNGPVWVKAAHVSGYTYDTEKRGASAPKISAPYAERQPYHTQSMGRGSGQIVIKAIVIPAAEREAAFQDARARYKSAQTAEDYIWLCQVFQGLGGFCSSEWYLNLCKSHVEEMKGCSVVLAGLEKSSLITDYFCNEKNGCPDSNQKSGRMICEDERAELYKEAVRLFESASRVDEYERLLAVFESMGSYKMSEQYTRACSRMLGRGK